MIRLPAQGIWRSAQNGDIFGDIIASRNIDLSEDGKAKLSRKAISLFAYGATSDSTLGTDPAFQGTMLGAVTDTDYAYILTPSATFVMHMTDALIPVLEAPAANSPTHGFDSDICMFKGLPHVSGGQYVSDLNLGFSTWGGRRISGLTTTVPHPLCHVEHLNQLAVGNGNTVKTYDTSYVLQTTLTIPAEYSVASIRWRQNNLYIGTRHLYGGEAKLFIWNGTGSTAQYGFGCGADWVYSLCEYDGSIAIVTSAGQIRRFNGGGFDDIAAFPVYYTPYSWASTNPASYLVGKVANRGMGANGSFLFVNIDGTLANGAGVAPGTYLPNQPSGLWQYSKTSGLSHRASPNFAPRLRLTPTALNSSYLSFSTPHQALTGDAVLVAPVTLTGLNNGQVYYAIPGSTTTMQLALSPADAYAGRHITIGGTVSTDSVVLDRYETIGNSTVSYPGGVFVLGAGRPSSFYAADVLFGAGSYDSSLTLYRATLCSLGMGRNVGSLTTPKLLAAGATNILGQAVSGSLSATFNRLACFVERMNLDTDELIIKFRTSTEFGLPSPLAFTGTGATWTSATTFTVDTTAKDVRSINIGDELEIITGQAAGYTCHVTAIENSTSTFTFTVDETMPVSSGTFDFVADNWEKWGTFTRANLTALRTGFLKTLTAGSAKWVQIKVELRGRGVAIQEMQILNAPKQ